MTGHLRDVVAISFSPDGQLLASASSDGTARLWRIADSTELASYKALAGSISCIAFSQDGRTLATGGSDKNVLLWDINGPR